VSDRIRTLLAALESSPRARTLTRAVALVAAVSVFALLTAHPHHARVRHPAPRSAPVHARQSPPAVPSTSPPVSTTPSLPPQDPQDQPGSESARRAHDAVARRPAFQHIPYDDGQLSITLVGETADGRPVLIVAASTVKQARDGWRRFLARYHDSGRTYTPRFDGRSR